MKKQSRSKAMPGVKLMRAALAVFALFVIIGWFFFRVYVKWNVPLYVVGLVLLTLTGAAGVYIGECAREGKTAFSVKKLVLCLPAAFLFIAPAIAIAYAINNALGLGNILAGLSMLLYTYTYLIIVYGYIISRVAPVVRKGIVRNVRAALALMIIIGIVPGFIVEGNNFYANEVTEYSSSSKAPSTLGVAAEKGERALVKDADVYVSLYAKDYGADGSLERPFGSIEVAQEYIRKLDKSKRDGITVAIMAGEYRTKGLVFGREDSGTKECPITYCAYGNGEVILNGGVSLDPTRFSPILSTDVTKLTGGAGARLKFGTAMNVVFTDLKELGLTAADWGKIYALGSYNTAAKYDGDTTGGLYCELFYNDARMTLARYPNNSEFLHTGAVTDNGDSRETYENGTVVHEEWDTMQNPRGGTVALDPAVIDRISGWSTLDDVWMYGYFKYDWADSSTPIKSVDAQADTLTMEYASIYGLKEGAPFCFFNVFEELDSPGEWYLDRENGLLYIYKPEDFDKASLELTLTSNTVVTVDGANYLTFDGFTVKGTRGDGFGITADGVTVKNCLIKNIAGNAITAQGSNNLASTNEICHTGKGGILLTGGDRETLTPGNNIADNNYIHDWSELYSTYQPGVLLSGVGNVCSHNEMHNSPHEAVTYNGNDNIIEYNYIHDVCLLTDDGGAIYAGRRWDFYGNIIRYNCVANLGSGDFKPDGIYMDDALAGQTIYGNLLVNIPKNAIHIGGGRDCTVRNNVIINAENPIHYDCRARDGAIANDGRTWAVHFGEGGDAWKLLEESPYQSELWAERYPACAALVSDFSLIDDPLFAANPANSTVSGNLIVQQDKRIGDICDEAYKYSDISGNALYRLGAAGKLFTDASEGDYSLKENSPAFEMIEDFEELPLGSIGRY